MTTYDAYGQPMQTVDPAVAVAGVAAAGLIGYALANDNDNYRYRGQTHYGYGGGYYRPRQSYGSYGYGGNYCR